ncbi:hypothetical protein [Hymenobacter ginkgonis]|nr:hypothetical protein [Hymenobacter ginkgonis]
MSIFLFINAPLPNLGGGALAYSGLVRASFCSLPPPHDYAQ